MGLINLLNFLKSVLIRNLWLQNWFQEKFVMTWLDDLSTAFSILPFPAGKRDNETDTKLAFTW